ncbi:MAG: hypothetical protein LUD14_11800 [Clostridiales bacterium]|nr:hypothetical protein [Clostridiales bacterium]
MTVNDLINNSQLEVIHAGDADAEITTPYCCDLLSVAMGNAPAGCAWCTVMANMNTLAVASLADCACIILCSGVNADDNMKLKAVSQNLTLLRTDQAVFDMALEVYNQIHA